MPTSTPPFDIYTIIPHHATDTRVSPPTYLCRCCPNGPALFFDPAKLLKHQESRMRYSLQTSSPPPTSPPPPVTKQPLTTQPPRTSPPRPNNPPQSSTQQQAITPPPRPPNPPPWNSTPEKQEVLQDDLFAYARSGRRDGFDKWKRENVWSGERGSGLYYIEEGKEEGEKGGG